MPNTKNYAVDSRHLILPKGYQLQGECADSYCWHHMYFMSGGVTIRYITTGYVSRNLSCDYLSCDTRDAIHNYRDTRVAILEL